MYSANCRLAGNLADRFDLIHSFKCQYLGFYLKPDSCLTLSLSRTISYLEARDRDVPSVGLFLDSFWIVLDIFWIIFGWLLDRFG